MKFSESRAQTHAHTEFFRHYDAFVFVFSGSYFSLSLSFFGGFRFVNSSDFQLYFPSEQYRQFFYETAQSFDYISSERWVEQKRAIFFFCAAMNNNNKQTHKQTNKQQQQCHNNNDNNKRQQQQQQQQQQ